MNAKKTKIRNLVIIFGDQLTLDNPALKNFDPDEDHIFMAEVMEESKVVWSTKMRTAFFLSAMRHFAEALRHKKWPLTYIELDNPQNTQSLFKELDRFLKTRTIEKIIFCEPGEFRIQEQMGNFLIKKNIPHEIQADTHFLCSRKEFSTYAENRSSFRMEYFYRMMRQKTGVLMHEGKPVGGEWNYDKENRGHFGKNGPQNLIKPVSFHSDQITNSVITLVEKKFPDHPGSLKYFNWPVTRDQAKKALSDFIKNRLPSFGAFQDAMWTGEPFLNHSLLSAALNVKLLNPKEVIDAAEKAYHEKKVSLPSAEGFIRQILGWREYVRGIYWLFMPHYIENNFLKASADLPDFYWTGKTNMNCLSHAIKQTLDYGYAHHIQRLMVTGLYALLLGVNPREVHKWYLAVYVDAIEWVELPNTLGMSQFGDDHIMASKPYIASGQYIDRMSNYCKTCPYNPKQKEGPDACPFTVLYWDFLNRHKDTLKTNPRMTMQVKNLQRIKPDQLKKIMKEAEEIRRNDGHPK